MSDLNLPVDKDSEITPIKTKCCGKIKNFFTKENAIGKRVYNWKFAVLIVAILALVWIVI